jgi:hypothetical protein
MSCNYNINLDGLVQSTYNISNVDCTKGQQFTINQGSTVLKPFTFSCPTDSFSQPAAYADGTKAGVYSGSCAYNSNNITGVYLFTIIFGSLTGILLLILIITLYKCRKSA